MTPENSAPIAGTAEPNSSFRSLLTRERWIEIARILAVAVVILLYQRAVVPRSVLFVGVAIGLYPLVKTGLLDLVRERKIGTEIFVTIATTIAMIGGEYVAGAILMTIILIAELVAELNTERARASIKALIGSVPQTALVRSPQGDVEVPITQVKAGDVVIVRAGEKIPIDGVVRAGEASVNGAGSDHPPRSRPAGVRELREARPGPHPAAGRGQRG